MEGGKETVPDLAKVLLDLVELLSLEIVGQSIHAECGRAERDKFDGASVESEKRVADEGVTADAPRGRDLSVVAFLPSQ